MLVEGQKPNQVSQLTILIPLVAPARFYSVPINSCSIGTVNTIAKTPIKWANGKNPRLYQTDGSDWLLTITERKRILLNNILRRH